MVLELLNIPKQLRRPICGDPDPSVPQATAVLLWLFPSHEMGAMTPQSSE